MRSDIGGVEAFDGISLRFGDRVVRCPPFTVAEAARFTAMLNEVSQPGADGRDTLATVEGFVAEFGARLDIGDVTLVDLGVECSGPAGPLDFGSLTFDGARDLCDVLRTAGWSGNVIERSVAQVRWLDRAPRAFGLDPDAHDPGALYALGNEFASALYLHIYGLAQDFFSRLATGPTATTWVLGPAHPSMSAAGSPT